MSTVSNASGTVTATYDALGRMVENNAGGAYSEFVYGPTGAKLAKMNGTSLIKAFVALPGGAKAIYNSSGTLAYFRHSDWLGSSRLTSTAARPTSMYSSTAYAPFGESQASQTSGAVDASFTGQDQDTVASLYDFTFRRYSPSQGRWISPDPLGTGAVDIGSPQSWNRYAYVNNNPLSYEDPTGLILCDYGPSDNGGEDFEDADDPNECTSNGGSLASDQTTVTVNGDSPGDVGTTIENGQQIFPWIVPNTAPNNCISPGVCKSKIDNMNLMEKGKTNYRDPLSICSTHTTVDNSTGATNSHVDLFNPGTSLPTMNGSIPLLPFHLLFDAFPDFVYNKTGFYPWPAGRTLCQ